jgi:hypothetical protein
LRKQILYAPATPYSFDPFAPTGRLLLKPVYYLSGYQKPLSSPAWLHIRTSTQPRGCISSFQWHNFFDLYENFFA